MALCPLGFCPSLRPFLDAAFLMLAMRTPASLRCYAGHAVLLKLHILPGMAYVLSCPNALVPSNTASKELARKACIFSVS